MFPKVRSTDHVALLFCNSWYSASFRSVSMAASTLRFSDTRYSNTTWSIVSTRSRKLSLQPRYQRTHKMMTSQSKYHPANYFSMPFSFLIASPFHPNHYCTQLLFTICTRAGFRRPMEYPDPMISLGYVL